jgi:hypothetical protein
MENFKQIGGCMMKKYIFFPLITFMTFIFFSSAAYAEWHFGIGTGLAFNNIDGKQGFTSVLVGPIKYDVKLDPGDFNDLTKTAFGFGGYATNGTLLIQYSYANIELEDKASEYVPAYDSTAKLTINFKMTGAELTVGYPVYKTASLVAMIDGGVRYTKHEFDNSLRVKGAITDRGSRSFDHDWTDAVLGVIVNVPLARQWTWNNRLNAGFGGSDGTYLASTGVTWRFLKHWSAGITGKYAAVKYENGSKSDRDWYFYDADESSVGINVLFNW